MGGLVAPRTIRGPRLYNRIQVNSISGDLIGLFCSFRNMLETKEPISLERTQSDDVSHPIGQGFTSGLRKKTTIVNINNIIVQCTIWKTDSNKGNDNNLIISSSLVNSGIILDLIT